MEDLKELSGFLIIFSIALLSFRYVLKFVFQKFGKDLNEGLRTKLVSLMTLNKKAHPFISYAALAFIILHVYIVTGFNIRFRFNEITGIIASLLIVLNVFVGILGQYIFNKPRPKWWKPLHRILTLLTIIMVIIHVD